MKRGDEKRKEVYEYILNFSDAHGYPPSVREIAAAVNLKSPSTVYQYILMLQEEGLIIKDARKTRALIPTRKKGLPIVGKVTAGLPILAYQEDHGVLSYDPGDGGDFFALRVIGDSMEYAGILDGDCVVVRQQPTARSGEIVVAMLDDEATVKRYMEEDGQIWLMPENDAYEPIDGTGCSIVGRVTAVVREL